MGEREVLPFIKENFVNFLSTKLLVLFFLVLASCNSTEKSNDISPQWSQGMQMFRSDINELAPYLFSEANYNDPKNSGKIEKKLNKFLTHSHSVAEMNKKSTPDHDPALKMASQEMMSNLKIGIASFQKGRKNYSRMIVKESLSQCFHCHTRNNVGPKYKHSGSISDKLKNSLAVLELVDYYVAVRNFDAAKTTLIENLENEQFRKSNPLRAEQALRKLLAISIRVNRDIPETILILNRLKTKQGFTKAIQNSFPLWIKHLKAWKSPKNFKNDCKEPLKTGDNFIAKAENLKSSKSYYGADVLYLGATTCLHDFLKTDSPNKKKAQALYDLGKSYGFLSDISFWNLSETYYEACIKTLPHSPLAKKCYKNWEDAIMVGYSGSGGVFIPNSVAEKKSQLKALSK